jgi:putative molybdopterin biosynthesis protein
MKGMKKLLSTKEVAQHLGVNDKMVYTLVAEKGLPASKVTGKWLFPIHLVDQWVETNTLNYPKTQSIPSSHEGLLVLSGSNDLLLDKTISLFNRTFSEYIAVFGNLGSMGGLRALRRNLCHLASSHLIQDEGEEYNFEYANKEFQPAPVIVNFCRREQGLLIQKNNPKSIKKFEDLKKPKITVVNRSLDTGTRLLFDRLLAKTGIDTQKLNGYSNEVNNHMEVGLEILSGRADAGPGIRPVASLLGLEFIPLQWERYDLLIIKERFFDKGIQNFLGLLQSPEFKKIADKMEGYDTAFSGKIVFPKGEQ